MQTDFNPIRVELHRRIWFKKNIHPCALRLFIVNKQVNHD